MKWSYYGGRSLIPYFVADQKLLLQIDTLDKTPVWAFYPVTARQALVAALTYPNYPGYEASKL
jgi:hypothetical protein